MDVFKIKVNSIPTANKNDLRIMEDLNTNFPEYIRKLVQSMSRRLQALIDNDRAGMTEKMVAVCFHLVGFFLFLLTVCLIKNLFLSYACRQSKNRNTNF